MAGPGHLVGRGIAASHHRRDPRHGSGARAVRRAGGRARRRRRGDTVATDPAAGEGRESGPARDECPRRVTRCGRPRRVARGRRDSRRRDAGPARRRGYLRRGPRHQHCHGLAGSRAARALPPYGGPSRTGVAVIPALRLDDVSFSYGSVPALERVSFSVAPGERVALLGRNGAGKSTLVRLVAGLQRPDEGTLWVGDWDTRDCVPEQLAWRVGSVFQHADQQLFARTVRDDVSFGPRSLGVGEREVERRTAHALEDLDLTAHAGHHPYDLPPALRKLAALAGALALEPAL
ncbi:MAG: hypothetical protein DMD42_01745, partial [Gemmatimonadetes bacterium]